MAMSTLGGSTRHLESAPLELGRDPIYDQIKEKLNAPLPPERPDVLGRFISESIELLQNPGLTVRSAARQEIQLYINKVVVSMLDTAKRGAPASNILKDSLMQFCRPLSELNEVGVENLSQLLNQALTSAALDGMNRPIISDALKSIREDLEHTGAEEITGKPELNLLRKLNLRISAKPGAITEMAPPPPPLMVIKPPPVEPKSLAFPSIDILALAERDLTREKEVELGLYLLRKIGELSSEDTHLELQILIDKIIDTFVTKAFDHSSAAEDQAKYLSTSLELFLSKLIPPLHDNSIKFSILNELICKSILKAGTRPENNNLIYSSLQIIFSASDLFKIEGLTRVFNILNIAQVSVPIDKQVTYVINANLKANAFHIRGPSQSRIFRGSEHGDSHTTCGWLAAYSAFTLDKVLSDNPAATHEELSLALIEGHPDKFLSEHREHVDPSVRDFGGSRDPVEGRIKAKDIRTIISKASDDAPRPILVMKADDGFDDKLIFYTPSGDVEASWADQKSCVEIIDLINKIKDGDISHGIIVTNDTFPAGQHYLTLALRKNTDGRIEIMVVESMNAFKDEYVLDSEINPRAIMHWLQNIITPQKPGCCSLDPGLLLGSSSLDTIPLVFPSGITREVAASSLTDRFIYEEAPNRSSEAIEIPSRPFFGGTELVPNEFRQLLLKYLPSLFDDLIDDDCDSEVVSEDAILFSLATAKFKGDETFSAFKKQYYPTFEINSSRSDKISQIAIEIKEAMSKPRIAPEFRGEAGVCDTASVLEIIKQSYGEGRSCLDIVTRSMAMSFYDLPLHSPDTFFLTKLDETIASAHPGQNYESVRSTLLLYSESLKKSLEMKHEITKLLEEQTKLKSELKEISILRRTSHKRHLAQIQTEIEDIQRIQERIGFFESKAASLPTAEDATAPLSETTDELITHIKAATELHELQQQVITFNSYISKGGHSRYIADLADYLIFKNIATFDEINRIIATPDIDVKAELERLAGI